jgi:hypothetical protein
MCIGRFTVWGNDNIEGQCRFMRGDLMISARYRRLVDWMKSR